MNYSSFDSYPLFGLYEQEFDVNSTMYKWVFGLSYCFVEISASSSLQLRRFCHGGELTSVNGVTKKGTFSQIVNI